MFVIHFLFIVLLANVNSFPQNNVGFPEGPGARPSQGFRPRPGDNFRPPGGSFGSSNLSENDFGSGGTGNGFGSNVAFNNGFRPQGSQNGNSQFSGLRPGNDFSPSNSRPGLTNSRPLDNLRPNSNSQNEFNPDSQGGDGFQNNRPGQDQTSTTASAAETTTRIPPRDPTNRIVYTVSCPCAYTRQYNPVCGTDGQTYGNLAVLQCARQCGTDVRVFLMGACGRNNG